MAGLSVLQIPSDARGNIDLDALKVACDERPVGLMLTIPNTLGLFEERIEEVVDLVHGCGGLVYGDGANMNALAGVMRPGDLGIDLMHYNLHKTFATPHGGGGPGSGPLAASDELRDYLPGAIVTREDEAGGPYTLSQPARSIVFPAALKISNQSLESPSSSRSEFPLSATNSAMINDAGGRVVKLSDVDAHDSPAAFTACAR